MDARPPFPMFSASQFELADLCTARRASGTTVSLVLPALNEGARIGAVLDAVLPLLGSLVDELVVIDGGSVDGTPEVAEQRGARVILAAELAAELGPVLGKGDSLWRSLGATTGDIVAWMDADIGNPGPQFVIGLLGPLLTDPELGYVKGFYRRPLQLDGEGRSLEGGRVTELTARPLLNLFWPALAGVVQPLAGEYAGRRSVLESVPFFTGYGVEFGLLIDLIEHLGPRGIAQVDLAIRMHRHQPLDALSRMAFAILQVAARRLRDSGRLRATEDLGFAYQQFVCRDGAIQPESVDVAIVERPPYGDYRRSRLGSPPASGA